MDFFNEYNYDINKIDKRGFFFETDLEYTDARNVGLKDDKTFIEQYQPTVVNVAFPIFAKKQSQSSTSAPETTNGDGPDRPIEVESVDEEPVNGETVVEVVSGDDGMETPIVSEPSVGSPIVPEVQPGDSRPYLSSH